MKLIGKYLISDSENKQCFHCHNSKPMARKNICEKCSKELESWRAKKNNKKERV